MAVITDRYKDIWIGIATQLLQEGHGLNLMLASKTCKSYADEALKRIYDRILLDTIKDSSHLVLKMRSLHTSALQTQKDLPTSCYSKLWSQVVQMTKRAEIPKPLSILSPSQFAQICQAYETKEVLLEDDAVLTMWKFLKSKNDKGFWFVATAQSFREWLAKDPKEIATIAYFNLDKSDLNMTRLPAEIGKFPLKSLKISQPCKFYSLPVEISALTQLDELEICKENCVKELPSLKNLSSLKRVIVASNKLQTFPDLVGLKQLVKVDVSNNCIRSFPVEIWDRDYELWIEGNCMDEIPPQIGKEWDRLIKGIDEILNPRPGIPFTRHKSKSILIDDRHSSYSSLIYYCILFSENKAKEGPINDFISKHLKRQLMLNGRVDLERVCKEMEGTLNPPQPINGLSKAATQVWMYCQAGRHKNLKRALLKIAKEDFEGFDPKWKEKVYELIYRFAGSPDTKDKILWGQEHAFEKTFRFLMAYDCIARGMFKLPTPSLMPTQQE